MSVAFYFDHNVPLVVAIKLREKQIDVLTAIEDHSESHADDELLQRTVVLGRVLVTHDHDFLELAHKWQIAGRYFPGIIFSHPMRISIGDLVSELELVA